MILQRLARFEHAVHILEYENYAGYDRAAAKMRTHPVRSALLVVSSPQTAELNAFLPQSLPKLLHSEILPTLHSRSSQLMSEFAFWPSSPPRERGGVFELRTYDLVPGTLLEWENAWRRGLEARKRFVVSASALTVALLLCCRPCRSDPFSSDIRL